MTSSYKYKKIICYQNKNDSVDNDQKQLHYKRLLSEFKNILEFKYITIETTTIVINNNICEIDIINSIILNNDNEDVSQQTFNINKNKYIDSIINKNKTILQNQNNQHPQTIQFIDIQLFIIQNSNDNNWYIYENNCNIIKEYKQPTSAITITILISLNSNNNKFITYINYQLGSISTEFQNNNNNNNNNNSMNLHDYFIANRFKKSFSQLSNYYYIVNSSFYKCFLEMVNDMRDYIYQGTFEIHVSVDQQEENNKLYIYKFKEFCQTNKLKSILIELSNGKHSNQMMTSSHHHCENLKMVQLKAYKIAFDLLVNEFNVSRLKIEILASCIGVPINDFQQQQYLSPSNYFEFHIKLIIPTTNFNHNNNNGNNDIKLLKEIMVIHNGHLSKNSFKISTDNTYTERFVTLRMYQIGKETAINKFESCKDQLIQNNFNISSSHREYSIYDSNIKLDLGWIE